MVSQHQGRPFRGYGSVTAGTDITATLYDAEGSAITLASNELLAIDSITIAGSAAGFMEVYYGADTTVDAGERLEATYAGANGGLSRSYNTPLYTKVGPTSIRAKVPSGNGILVVAGQIIKRG